MTGPFPVGAHPRLGVVVGAPDAAAAIPWAGALAGAGWAVGGWIPTAGAAAGAAAGAGTAAEPAGGVCVAGDAGLRCFRTVVDASRAFAVHAVVLAVDDAVAVLIEQAIRAGKHLLCPRTAVPDLAAARRWSAEASRAGAAFLVHQASTGDRLVPGGRSGLGSVAESFLRAVLQQAGAPLPGGPGPPSGPDPNLIPVADLAAGTIRAVELPNR